ncbi:hypothetical protein, partial [Nocardia farcinica]|uniref:hypothetical protein n=1 Tax=Nocardia farcinica TaxID=37329 RepID=UPI002454D71C
FTPHEPARAATRTNHLGRYLAIHGESGGHQRGLKWPPMGRMSWPLTASQWGQASGWRDVAAYSFVRRSMLAISFTNDGHRAVDNAGAAFGIGGVSPRVKGLAEKQMAFGYALVGDENASLRALDRAMTYLAMPLRDSDDLLGQRSVVHDDLFAIFRGAGSTHRVGRQ